MARATRSTTQNQEKDSSSATTTTITSPTSPPRTKAASKKRKRQGLSDADEPSSKLPRTDNATIKEENDLAESNPEEEVGQSSKRLVLPNAGDAPIHPDDAQKILDILEMIDTQGLLDRIFPLPEDSTNATSQQYFSLRTLLKESPNHKLLVLRSAVQHLFPISSHSRSRPSKPAKQQRQFCDIALSLLDQASFRNVSIPPGLDSILPENQSDDDDVVASHLSSPRQLRRYVLKQKLPTGEWWTSLSNDSYTSSDIKSLTTGHAELVLSLPTPSAPSSITVSTSSATSKPSTSTASAAVSVVPSLGTYTHLKTLPPKAKPIAPRRVSSGSFLDYGVNASFAPTFCQDGTEIGREQLGELLWRKEQRRRERIESMRVRVEGQGEIVEVTEDNLDPEILKASRPVDELDVEESLKELLPPEDVASIKSALSSLELENAVQELLDRNARALLRLQELQKQRLLRGEGEIGEGSEEWDTAQAIMDSLALLASLRPRSSKDGPDSAPLIPAPALLRVLHKTIPISATPGWHGTLPSSKSTALHDNTTVKIKLGAGVPATAATANSTTTASATTTPIPTPAPSYYQYGSYAGTAQQYRPPAAPSYTFKPTQTPAGTTYYPPAYVAGQQQQGAQQQQGYATAQSYSFPTTGQLSYGSWYNYAPQYAAAAGVAAAGGSNSGRGTPTQAQVAPVPTATSYGSFFASTQTAQTPGQQPKTPAVANTVTSKTNYPGQPGQPVAQTTWAAANGYKTPVPAVGVLPAHLRSSAVGGAGQPGTPTPGTPTPGTPNPSLLAGVAGATGYQQQTPYYSAYQQPAATPTAR